MMNYSSSSSLLPPSSTIALASPMSFDPHSNESTFPFQFPSTTTTSTLNSNPPELLRDTLFLGLDLSTQALKASFIDERLETIAEYSIRFDQDLPHFKTTSGVHIGEKGVITSPVMMWIEAIDLLFSNISSTSEGRNQLSRVVALSGAAQQHAPVFWSHESSTILSSLNPKESLANQLKNAFASLVSPNWQDSSTTLECREMEEAIGGQEEMARRIGSRAHERFTGPQILKLRKENPDLYNNTDRISLASSFLTTILCGDSVRAIEESDACGMNLWNLESGNDWDKDLIAVVAGGNRVEAKELRRKLGMVEKDGGKPAGEISSWLVERFGFSSECIVSPCTGDNPATLLSFSLLSSDVICSLGTSDTILLSTTTYAPTADSHTFAYPANLQSGKRSYMGMLCYKNGSLPREYICKEYANNEWTKFNSLVDEFPLPTEKDSKKPIGFYFLKPEIIPHNGNGIHRFDGDGKEIDEFADPSFNPSAILTSQFLSFKLRSSPMLASSNGIPNRIFAVGGASSNPTILQTLSTILSAPIYRSISSTSTASSTSASSVNSCSLGAGMKAYWTYCRTQSGQEELCFEDAVTIARQQTGGGGTEVVVEPDLSVKEGVEGMLKRFAESEHRCCV